jgi:hypothetical protein
VLSLTNAGATTDEGVITALIADTWKYTGQLQIEFRTNESPRQFYLPTRIDHLFQRSWIMFVLAEAEDKVKVLPDLFDRELSDVS